MCKVIRAEEQDSETEKKTNKINFLIQIQMKPHTNMH